jgi:parallel beta-helix repeat protein
MKKVIFGAAAMSAAFLFVQTAYAGAAAPNCAVRSLSTISAPGADAAKCQAAISKNVAKFAKTAVKTRGKCLSQRDPLACPNAKDDEKVAKAAVKAAEGIAKSCGSGANATLGNSYSSADASDIGQCATSQVNALAAVFLGLTHGTPGVFTINAGVNDCQDAIAKEGVKLQAQLHKTAAKCIDTAHKAGSESAAADCAPSMDQNGYISPSDAKTADKLEKSVLKATDSIAEACGGSFDTSAVFSCPGATTASQFAACAECAAVDATIDFLEATYNETGSIVTAAGGLQNAVDAASAGDKLLLLPGDYEEEVLLPAGVCVGGSEDGNPCLDDDLEENECPGGGSCESAVDGLAIVGCGGATGDRPRLVPESGVGDNGIFGVGIDGLTFQSLELDGWADNGIFTSNSNDIVYRDIVGDGNDINTNESVTIYSVFPVRSSNVLVEGCEVSNIRDAAIYVGQAYGTTVRYNRVLTSVTGIEIENSEFGDVYGNFATANAAGILSFKLTGPEKQEHGNHHFHHNVSINNNTENFGIPGTTVSTVPRGTGFFVISDQNSLYEYNIIEGNTTFGIAIVDQVLLNSLDPGSFDPQSPDQNAENITVSNNRIRQNALDPDLTRVPDPLFAKEVTLLLGTSDANANGICFKNNGIAGAAVPTSNLMSYQEPNAVPVCLPSN